MIYFILRDESENWQHLIFSKLYCHLDKSVSTQRVGSYAQISKHVRKTKGHCYSLLWFKCFFKIGCSKCNSIENRTFIRSLDHKSHPHFFSVCLLPLPLCTMSLLDTCILGFVASDDKLTRLLPDSSVSDGISSECKTDEETILSFFQWNLNIKHMIQLSQRKNLKKKILNIGLIKPETKSF